MIAKQSVYLTADRSQVVPEGHADAKFLLVRVGHEIEEALVEKHNALDLVNSEATEKPAPAPSREHMPPPTATPSPAPDNGKKLEGKRIKK